MTAVSPNQWAWWCSQGWSAAQNFRRQHDWRPVERLRNPVAFPSSTSRSVRKRATGGRVNLRMEFVCMARLATTCRPNLAQMGQTVRGSRDSSTCAFGFSKVRDNVRFSFLVTACRNRATAFGPGLRRQRLGSDRGNPTFTTGRLVRINPFDLGALDPGPTELRAYPPQSRC